MERPATSKSRGICKYYNTPRGCFNGDNCKFKHGEHEKLTPYDMSKSCRYFAAGYCKRGEKCWFTHVSPAKPPTDSGESLICAICMEEPATFGLLVDCSHVFCIACIRNWRGQESMADDFQLSYVHKKCPYCRTPSKFVVPSSHFYPKDHPGKAITIERYKASLQRVPCKYFIASTPGHRYCPFGRDCMYQHLNEDGTPYIFSRGVDYYMPQRDRRLRGFLREVLTRSTFDYYPVYDPWAVDPWGVRPPSETIFDEESELEQSEVDPDSGTFFALTQLFSAQNPSLDTSTEYALTASPSTSSTSTVTDPQPAFEAIYVQTLLNVQSPDHALYSIPSSPSSIGSVPPLLSETEVDPSGLTNPSVVSDEIQDSRPSQPIEEPAASSDRVTHCQSLPSPPHSCVCFPQRIACLDTGTPVPTSPVPSHMDTGESQSLSPPAPQFEISSVIEVGVTPSPQSPTRDPLFGEVSDTRQQEPPFMTDGRGRVVWSHSGVKRGNSPLARSQDRTPNTAGDRN